MTKNNYDFGKNQNVFPQFPLSYIHNWQPSNNIKPIYRSLQLDEYFSTISIATTIKVLAWSSNHALISVLNYLELNMF